MPRLSKAGLCLCLLFYCPNLRAQQQRLGFWSSDASGLPVFSYTASLPYKAVLADGRAVKLPPDPWFILGNYRMNVFAHVSGEYELLCAQRAWGRVNQGESPNSGLNSSRLQWLDARGKVIETRMLTGMRSISANPDSCKRSFGCGYASYSYTMPGLSCARTLSVKPSTNPADGLAAFLLTVKLKNTGRQVLHLNYLESVTAHYQSMQQQHGERAAQTVLYSNKATRTHVPGLISCVISGRAKDPFLNSPKNAVSTVDLYPPSLFIKAATGETNLISRDSADRTELIASNELRLKPGEEKQIELAIGYSFAPGTHSMQEMAAELLSHRGGNRNLNFAADWKRILPSFPAEKDSSLRSELVWHAYTLEAMAKYNSYYRETEIPQGTVYDYDWGIHASARDHLQHALPLVYYNPALAKSVLRYSMKKTTALGEIKLIESGFGTAGAFSYFTSDQQLFYFLLLSEYLRVTHDYAFLDEKVEPYPLGSARAVTVLEFVNRCFSFLHNEIGTGSHGLVRLMNSDWNDAVFYIVKAPYNRVLYSGESHMNSAMAVTFLDVLIPVLQQYASMPKAENAVLAKKLLGDMSFYKNGICTSFMKDLGNRDFSRRMYFNKQAYGEENMFLEPQGYLLQMKELGAERKKKLYEALKLRLYEGEKLGAREQQKPEFEDEEFDKGSRENGGFWYALNGPVIIGLAGIDKPEAWRRLKQMTFANYSRVFPQFWSSYWSASDNVESSLIPMEGLPDQSLSYSDQPVFCAHPHAWILYCYYRLKEAR